MLIGLCHKRVRFLNGDDRLSKLKVSCFVVIGAVAVTLAAYSATALQRAAPPEPVANETPATQTSNRASKTNRLLVQTAFAAISQKPVFALASAIPDLPTIEQAPNPVIAALPPIPEPAPVPPAATPAPEPKSAKVAPVSREKAPDKPKHLPPPHAQSNGILDDGQIAGLKTRLQLSADQVEYWPAVEAALREVVQSQLRGRKAVHGRVNIDTNSPEVQKLIYAAMPLLMRLREDQKGEVRKLARVIGLEQVASQI
jgi:hypothetical protein